MPQGLPKKISAPSHFLPFLYPAPVHPKIQRHSQRRFASRDPRDRCSL